MPTSSPIMDGRRRTRVAIGMLAQGIQREEIARQIGGIDHCIRDVLEKQLGFPAAADISSRFTGHSIVVPMHGVYAIAAIGLALVKIGWSTDIHKRLRQLSCCFPAELLLVGNIEGGTRQTEAKLHENMARWHHRGEWFRFTNDSKSHIQEAFRVKISALITFTHLNDAN